MATLVYRNPDWTPEGERQYLFKCRTCGSFFLSTEEPGFNGWSEPCPVCGRKVTRRGKYPEWKYRLLMLFKEVTKDA